MDRTNIRLVLCWSFVVILSTQIPVTYSHDHEAESSEGHTQDQSAAEHLDEAFEEQGYYLQRLFLEYGTNGTLTYDGLQNLLGSLGLGEVSILEIRHGVVKHSSPSPSHSHHLHQPSGTASFNKSTGDRDHAQPTGSSGTEGGLQNGLLFMSDHPAKMHLHENCLNVTQLLWNFGLGQASYITPAHFTFLCPALLYQIDSGVCLRHSESDTHEGNNSEPFLKALGWASLALLVISLPSLVALGLAPLLPPASLKTFLCPMAAMAVSTLCGDALLHLLPHASSGPHRDHRDAVLKGLSVLGGLYLLFVFESVLGLKQHYKKSRKRKQNAEVEREMEELEGSSLHHEQTVSSESGHGHSHRPSGQGSSNISSMVWMVVMGDGIHNLTDGLAIGVAFSQSLTGGLSTTIAVFCHELPHELGDLAVLLAAGWPVRRLAVFSLLSAMLGYVGIIAGTVLGNQWAQHSPWILTLTAGVFLYVALADMMPEMLHGERGSMSPLRRFILQNLGLMTGGAIMLCIALFEEDIAVNLGDG